MNDDRHGGEGGGVAAPLGDDVRWRLAAAAVTVIAERGYREASVEEIAARAELDVDAFQANFAGKEDCYVRIFDVGVSHFMARMACAYESHDDWTEAMVACANVIFEWGTEDPVRARFAAESREIEQARARGDVAVDALTALIDAGREELEDPASVPRSTAEGLAGAIWQMASRRIDSDRSSQRELWRELLFSTLRPYIGAERAHAAVERHPGPGLTI